MSVNFKLSLWVNNSWRQFTLAPDSGKSYKSSAVVICLYGQKSKRISVSQKKTWRRKQQLRSLKKRHKLHSNLWEFSPLLWKQKRYRQPFYDLANSVRYEELSKKLTWINKVLSKHEKFVLEWKSRYHDLSSKSADGVLVNYEEFCASISTLPAVHMCFKPPAYLSILCANRGDRRKSPGVSSAAIAIGVWNRRYLTCQIKFGD